MSNADPVFDEGSARVPARRVILLVDAEHHTYKRFLRVLDVKGFALLHIADPLKALDAARGFRPAGVITALAFPGPIDGLMLTRVLRADTDTERVPIVALTGRAYDGEREAALRAGCDVVLSRSCSCDALVEALAQRRIWPAARRPHDSLVWSRRGEVACAQHAPDPASERWRMEAWCQMPARVGDGRMQYQCQHCSERPIVHRGKTVFRREEN